MTWELQGSREHQALFTSRLLQRSLQSEKRGTEAFPQPLNFPPLPSANPFRAAPLPPFIFGLFVSEYVSRTDRSTGTDSCSENHAALSAPLCTPGALHQFPCHWGKARTPLMRRSWTCDVEKLKSCLLQFYVKEQYPPPGHAIAEHPNL